MIQTLTKLFAFGDSFTYGYELSDCPTNDYPTHSLLTYSALTAKHLGTEYVCLAEGFASNNKISKFIRHADISKDDVALAMWTFTDRYSFMFTDSGDRTVGHEDKWWHTLIDHEQEQRFERTIDHILSSHQVLNKIGCKYLFLCNNLELQKEIQYNKHIDIDKWVFLSNDSKMLNYSNTHPGDEAHKDVFNIIKERLDGRNR